MGKKFLFVLTKKARSTLEQLTRYHPLESEALLRLGVIYFKDRNFKKAETYFSRIFAIAQSEELPAEVLDSARAYHVLSFHYRGKKDQAYELAESYKNDMNVLSEEDINRLDLEERDRRVLWEIIKKGEK